MMQPELEHNLWQFLLGLPGQIINEADTNTDKWTFIIFFVSCFINKYPGADCSNI